MLKLFYSNVDLVFNKTLTLKQFKFSGISHCAPWQTYLLVEKLFDIPVLIFIQIFGSNTLSPDK